MKVGARVIGLVACVVVLAWGGVALGAAGDVQVKTDHPWYPGELSCSTFERLFKTQAALYQRVTGRAVESDEDKALAAWYWRNLNYAHAEEGRLDYFGQGFEKSDWTREYWTGLFAQGFGLCGTTHSQWTAEMEHLLGHCRARAAGVDGHNSFEVYLTGGAYGEGRWVLLDHDISTVIFAPDGSRLMSIGEIVPNVKTLTDPKYRPDRQRGWRVSGLYDADAGGVYTAFRVAEYLAGYAGPPPMVNLRPGETMRRYLRPGLEDGKTFVFWGRNYMTGGVPGPERSRTWVNQPEKMYRSVTGTGHKDGQARYANAVYTYTPDFAGGSYKEGVIEEAADHVTFEFYTPYVIACTPANQVAWGIYEAGGKNGLVVTGKIAFPVEVSTDQGRSWRGVKDAQGAVDLTDLVKGRQQYWLRFGAGAAALKDAGVSWRTVCQCNGAIIPRLHDGENKVTFLAGGRGIVSAGPELGQAKAHVVEGAMGSSSVTLELKTPRGERPVHLYASSWNGSGAPPGPTKYNSEYSGDGGKTWRPVVKDWQIVRRTPEPGDFWSQSFCYGDAEISGVDGGGGIRVRFTNSDRRSCRKAEAHLVYEVGRESPTRVTFAWREGGGEVKTASHVYGGRSGVEDEWWRVRAGSEVETEWVEYGV